MKIIESEKNFGIVQKDKKNTEIVKGIVEEISNQDVAMVTTYSMPRKQTGDNSTDEGEPPQTNDTPGRSGEGPADFARREERMTEAVIGTKSYPSPSAFENV